MNLIKLFQRVLMALYNRVLILLDPAEYARSVGVNLGKNPRFYGAMPGMFGSEPWLITLGDDVHIVSGCNFVTHDGGVLILRKDCPDLEITKPIIVGNNVYIGLNCTLLPGVIVGNNVIIGAGSIVTKNIPNNCVVAGVPARVIKSLDEYFNQAKEKSLGFGQLSAKEKESALKKHFGIKT